MCVVCVFAIRRTQVCRSQTSSQKVEDEQSEAMCELRGEFKGTEELWSPVPRNSEKGFVERWILAPAIRALNPVQSKTTKKEKESGRGLDILDASSLFHEQIASRKRFLIVNMKVKLGSAKIPFRALFKFSSPINAWSWNHLKSYQLGEHRTSLSR